MKLFIGLIATLVSTLALAQNPEWKLTAVPQDKPVGYIYHTYSTGTQTSANRTEKVVAGLRLVCSLKGEPMAPIIAVYWDSKTQSSDPYNRVDWSVDGRTFPTGVWIHDSKIVYNGIPAEHDLYNALKAGKIVKVTWVSSDSIKHETVFDLTEFKTHLKEFETVCKL